MKITFKAWVENKLLGDFGPYGGRPYFVAYRAPGWKEGGYKKVTVTITDEKEVCTWRRDDDDDNTLYWSGCDVPFQFTEDGIEENDFIACPFCGKKIEEK